MNVNLDDRKIDFERAVPEGQATGGKARRPRRSRKESS